MPVGIVPGGHLVSSVFLNETAAIALPGMVTAARQARRFVEEARTTDGLYDLKDWPGPAIRRRRSAATTTVVRLRTLQRLTMGFLDPVEDALFLTAGLRGLGVDASFHLGRERAPAVAPAGFFAWVSVDGNVVSTSLPVEEEYLEVYRAPGER